MARDYVLRQITLRPEWRVLDIGPGKLPLLGPQVWYLDRDVAMLDQFPAERCITADIDRPLPVREHEFDYVYCSHVMEHARDPVAFAAELSRVAPRGVVVTPHAFKDAIFNFEDNTHRWWCFPPTAPGAPLRMMRADVARMQLLKDAELQRALCHVYRTMPETSADHAVIKQWVDTHEEVLDVIVPWEGSIHVEVIG